MHMAFIPIIVVLSISSALAFDQRQSFVEAAGTSFGYIFSIDFSYLLLSLDKENIYRFFKMFVQIFCDISALFVVDFLCLINLTFCMEDCRGRFVTQVRQVLFIR